MPAAALTADSLAAACAPLAAQSAASGEALHLRAAFLLCGVKLAPTARQLVVPTTPADPDAAQTAGAISVVAGAWPRVSAELRRLRQQLRALGHAP